MPVKTTVLEQLKNKHDDELLAMCQEANSYHEDIAEEYGIEVEENDEN